jgi:hypothetical protein
MVHSGALIVMLNLEQQSAVCARYGVEAVPAPDHLKMGISLNVRAGLLPVNGLRCRPEGDTTGWYIWAGEEWSDDPEFFVPLHVAHLEEWCPLAIPFLQLPPGWRFLVAPGYEDVWQDPQLLGPRPSPPGVDGNEAG